MTTMAWVVFLDVYGFSALVRQSGDNPSAMFQRLSAAVTLARHQLSQSKLKVFFHAYSDSAFLTYPIPSEDQAATILHSCYEDVSRLQAIYARQRLPIRGGIARGMVSVGTNLAIGEAVLEAYRCDQLLAAPIVIVPASQLPSKKDDRTITKVYPFLQDIPTRGGGLMRAVVVRPENLANHLALLDGIYKQVVISGPPDVAAAWDSAREILKRGYKRADQ